MSPRLRPKKSVRTALAIGRLIRLVELGGRKISATVDLDPSEPSTSALLAGLRAWEVDALQRARRGKRRGAFDLQAAAPRLRLRPTVRPTAQQLRLVGAVSAVDPRVDGCGGDVRISLRAAPVILPAAGIVALELRLLQLVPR